MTNYAYNYTLTDEWQTVHRAAYFKLLSIFFFKFMLSVTTAFQEGPHFQDIKISCTKVHTIYIQYKIEKIIKY